ncbi:MAG TPA: response regulator transcription factor [Terriglobales bacterium]|nr:response regulator transcription factor [Terriglobales bacterium]
MRPLIFVVCGETEICHMSQSCLEEAGYSVRTFSSMDVLEEAEYQCPSLMLISLVLPDGNGIALCRRLRQSRIASRVAVVFLLEEDTEEHRVLVLDSGADDCIAKPFSDRELVARIQAVLRRLPRSGGAARAKKPDLVIDSWAMKVTVGGEPMPITSLEFRVIEYLARHRGQVFTRDLLLDAVWGDTQFVTPRSVDACIRRIRKKLELNPARPAYLKTVRGIGYRLDAVAEWQSAVNEGCTCVVCTSSTNPPHLLHSPSSKRKRPSA